MDLQPQQPPQLQQPQAQPQQLQAQPQHPQEEEEGEGSQLVRLGRWYATLPTSNVASERVFGVVRGLEDDQRRRAGEETVTIETLARCNSWLVDVVREKHGRL